MERKTLSHLMSEPKQENSTVLDGWRCGQWPGGAAATWPWDNAEDADDAFTSRGVRMKEACGRYCGCPWTKWDLYSEPDAECSYVRDQKQLPFSHDFSFLGVLVANWPEACESVHLFRSDTRYALRFETSDGVLCLPLSGRPQTVRNDYSLLRKLDKEEVEQYFYSRFFQLRDILERRGAAQHTISIADQLVLNEGIIDGNGLLRVTDGTRWEAGDDVYELLGVVAENNGCHREQTQGSIFCPMDGWIEPVAAVLESDPSETLPGRPSRVDYLLCPNCLGNVDFICP